MENRLKYEKSPYLLQHKDNPVNWYPWCEAAFQKASCEDKPVFLSIGYSTCHWCHVMAHESFEDEEAADFLNKNFVCIKVDREERPDIDAVYMAVCQAMNGSGGWPLTVFMTPDQKPFFAGTYFPKKSRYGQPGLMELLLQVSQLWNTEREKLLETGEQLKAALGQMQKTVQGMPDKKLLKNAFYMLRQRFDTKWGGFGAPPKFPTPHNLLFLMQYAEWEKVPEALQMAEDTLTSMAKGGIFDQIGGGFSRYSTDEKWLVPHFEKMLYDNSLLLMAYLKAYQITGKEFYAYVARKTAEYILRELRDDLGGFYCGQDADSDGVEGKYYVFTPKEVIDILGRQEGREFCRLYGITENGNFEGGSIPNCIGQRGQEWKADDQKLKKLYDYRKVRTSLHRDDKVLLSWNAWTIIALAQAGGILKKESYLKAAIHAQQFIETYMTDTQDRLFLRFRDGEAANMGQLEDYAVYALALLELYRATFDVKYLVQAIHRGKQMAELFEDKEQGGYFISSFDGERLIARLKETYDGAIPSGNSAAAMVLEELAGLTGERYWRELSDRQHRFMAGEAESYPAAHCFGMLAMGRMLYPHRELICTGNKVPTELKEYLRNHPANELCILFKSKANAHILSECAPFTKSYPVPEESTLWYLCENGSCQAPVREFRQLKI